MFELVYIYFYSLQKVVGNFEINLMNQLKKQGIAVMFVSSEMPELIGVADRILVMSNGGFGGIHEKLLTALKAKAQAEL